MTCNVLGVCINHLDVRCPDMACLKDAAVSKSDLEYGLKASGSGHTQCIQRPRSFSRPMLVSRCLIRAGRPAMYDAMYVLILRALSKR